MKKINLGYVHMESFKKGDALEDGSPGPDARQYVLPANKAFVLTINYPLHTAFVKPFIKHGNRGMTREELILKIIEAYKEVYRSPAKYGIWGHGMGDLMLHTATVDKDNVITVGCDS